MTKELQDVLYAVWNKAFAEYMMADKERDAQGFDNQLRNMKGKTGTDQCEVHDFQPINVEQCVVCGLRRKKG